MSVDTQTQAILLLTAHLQKDSQDEFRPLTASEWSRFAGWLNEHGKRPEELLEVGDPVSLLHGWEDRSVTHERLLGLLGRSAALGVALEKWERAGLWVVARSHADYPSKLKKRLGQDSPAVLIGYGNLRILNTPGVAVVGSREASEDDLRFAWDLGRKIAEEGHIVVSGGARGVDETAMLGCIEAGGKAAGILADSLLRAVTSTKYRNALATDQIVLVSPFNPESGFNVGNAMARNKYIYCCADAAVIVASGKNKGGTWNGAVEALRAEWVPVWVRTTPDSPDGNASLIRKGAHDLRDRLTGLHELTNSTTTRRDAQADLLFSDDADSGSHSAMAVSKDERTIAPTPASPANATIAQMSFVEFFVARLAASAGSSTKTADEIAKMLEVKKPQVQAWLKDATQQGLVVKSTKPLRYRVASDVLQRFGSRALTFPQFSYRGLC
ncbi:MAG TPA: DNA-processing protein DprA [Phycisphaerales bacterium]|nr:DNA-processing protein DprA [Phycisphaerales bacterium]